jgi:hypothetical protein
VDFRPRLGGISFLHRFGSALNHHVHLHVCATDGGFMPAVGGAGCCAPPAFLPVRPITQADLATVTERVRRRVIRFLQTRSPARRRGRRRHARLGKEEVFSRRQRIRGPAGRITLVRYVLPRHWLTMWAANWVGRGRGRKSTRPGGGCCDANHATQVPLTGLAFTAWRPGTAGGRGVGRRGGNDYRAGSPAGCGG